VEWWQILVTVPVGLVAIFVLINVLRWVSASPRTQISVDLQKLLENRDRAYDDLEEVTRFPRRSSGGRAFLRGNSELYAKLALVSTSREIALEAKKNLLLSEGPRTFYFIDEEAVNELYPQIFRDADPVEMETKESETKTGGIKGKLHLVEPKMGRSTEVSVKKKYLVEQNLGAKYNQIERFLLENDQVSLGLEDFDESELAVEDFRNMCRQMDERFQFKVPEDLQEQYIKQQEEALAVKKVEELEKAHDYLLLRGAFSVSSSDDNWLMVYEHPLNKNVHTLEKRAMISFICPKASSKLAGSATFSSSSRVNLTVLGKVVCWQEVTWILSISPLAIY